MVTSQTYVSALDHYWRTARAGLGTPEAARDYALTHSTRLHIEGRRWFQKTYGNTYHSVRIWKDAKLLATLPYQYGYDDQYLQTALDWLKANGYAPADAPYGTLYLRETLGYTWEVSDVPRQKDL